MTNATGITLLVSNGQLNMDVDVCLQTMIQMMRTMLGKQLAKGKVTPEEAKELMKKMQEDIDEEIQKGLRERNEAEEVGYISGYLTPTHPIITLIMLNGIPS